MGTCHRQRVVGYEVRDNLPYSRKPPRDWILFEAGALSKTLADTHVVPYLIGLQTKEISPPLSQFNMIQSDEDGTLELLKAINLNLALGDASLETDVLIDSFRMWWPKLKETLLLLPDEKPDAPLPPSRPAEDMLSEILDLLRQWRTEDRANLAEKCPRNQKQATDQTTPPYRIVGRTIRWLSSSWNYLRPEKKTRYVRILTPTGGLLSVGLPDGYDRGSGWRELIGSAIRADQMKNPNSLGATAWKFCRDRLFRSQPSSAELKVPCQGH